MMDKYLNDTRSTDLTLDLTINILLFAQLYKSHTPVIFV